MHSAADLTTRVRIRDAAILRFAADGFSTSLRTIATDVGVSPALIVHHFGSRAGLVEACHAHVLEVTEREKAASVASTDPDLMFTQMAGIEGYAPIVGFVLRCLQDGGSTGQRILTGMREATLAYLQAGVEAGTIRPSRDPGGRAHLLVAQSVGLMLTTLLDGDGRLDMETLPGRIRELFDLVVVASLELYTEGLLTDSTLLDGYLAHLNHTPEESR